MAQFRVLARMSSIYRFTWALTPMYELTVCVRLPQYGLALYIGSLEKDHSQLLFQTFQCDIDGLYTHLRREAVVKLFLPPFGCDLVRPPYVVIFGKKVPGKGAFFFSSIWQLYIRDFKFEEKIYTRNQWKRNNCIFDIFPTWTCSSKFRFHQTTVLYIFYQKTILCIDWLSICIV